MEDLRAISVIPRLLLTILSLAFFVLAQGEVSCAYDGEYNIVELKVDTLPSLSIPRSGHATLCLDGELTVLGGHTDSFIPTATAEYLHDGKWYTVPLAYPHDHSTVIKLRSGKVFMAGGHKEPLGIGQLYSAELYDPTSHTSQGFGCLDTKRAYASAIEMTDGQIVVTGNWFDDDGIEMFADIYDPKTPNAQRLKDVSFARAKPYILRVSEDDAIIFGSLSNKAEPVDNDLIDRLKGLSYREPFLGTWRPLHTIDIQRSYNHFIGDEDSGIYEWLLPVENVETGQVAIARVKGPTVDGDTADFSLLATQQPLPDSINGKAIVYSSLVCDRQRGIAYLIGDNDDAQIFVAAILYNTTESSPITIYMTAPQPIIARSTTPALTKEGDLVFAGGHLNNNFSTSNAVFRVPVGQTDESAAAAASKTSTNVWWIVLILILLIIIAVAAVVSISRRIKSRSSSSQHPESYTAETIEKSLSKDELSIALFTRIQSLMEDEQLYLDPNLRASDVAVRLGSNTAYVSAAINSQCGCSFTQFLATYRISYAQKLMREEPERKISTISTLSGFSTDSTFFRVFRTITGMSPKEWLSSNQGQ